MERILHQLRLVVDSILYKVLYIPGGDRRISEPSTNSPTVSERSRKKNVSRLVFSPLPETKSKFVCPLKIGLKRYVPQKEIHRSGTATRGEVKMSLGIPNKQITDVTPWN